MWYLRDHEVLGLDLRWLYARHVPYSLHSLSVPSSGLLMVSNASEGKKQIFSEPHWARSKYAFDVRRQIRQMTLCSVDMRGNKRECEYKLNVK